MTDHAQTMLEPCPFCNRRLVHDDKIKATIHPKMPYGEYCPLKGFRFASDRADIIKAWNTRAHSTIGTPDDAREALEKALIFERDYWADEVNDVAADLQEGCAFTGAVRDRIAYCSERAERINKALATPPAPVREADPTQKQRVAMMRARSATPVRATADGEPEICASDSSCRYPRCKCEPSVRAAAEPGEMRWTIPAEYIALLRAIDHTLSVDGKVYANTPLHERLQRTLALSPASANEGSGR